MSRAEMWYAIFRAKEVFEALWLDGTKETRDKLLVPWLAYHRLPPFSLLKLEMELLDRKLLTWQKSLHKYVERALNDDLYHIFILLFLWLDGHYAYTGTDSDYFVASKKKSRTTQMGT